MSFRDLTKRQLEQILVPREWERGTPRVKQMEAKHRSYVESWVENKKHTGDWLSSEDYEALTGRPGRK